VVLKTFTADALSAARIIGAVAEGPVFFFVTFFHVKLLSVSKKFTQSFLRPLVLDFALSLSVLFFPGIFLMIMTIG